MIPTLVSYAPDEWYGSDMRNVGDRREKAVNVSLICESFFFLTVLVIGVIGTQVKWSPAASWALLGIGAMGFAGCTPHIGMKIYNYRQFKSHSD